MNNIIIGLILGIIITFLIIETRNRCFISDSATQLLYKNIQKLTRQVARWSVAAEQDTSPLVAVLHANYGVGYASALTDIATPEQIKSATNVDIYKLKSKVSGIQDKVTMHLSKICPGYAPKNTYLTRIAKEG